MPTSSSMGRFIVVGGGLAGLAAVIKLAEALEIRDGA